jgi:hypothetical protein
VETTPVQAQTWKAPTTNPDVEVTVTLEERYVEANPLAVDIPSRQSSFTSGTSFEVKVTFDDRSKPFVTAPVVILLKPIPSDIGLHHGNMKHDDGRHSHGHTSFSGDTDNGDSMDHFDENPLLMPL